MSTNILVTVQLNHSRVHTGPLKHILVILLLLSILNIIYDRLSTEQTASILPFTKINLN